MVPEYKPNMASSTNVNESTVQGRETLVPAPVGSGQAGSQASSSSDRSAPVVDDLATGALNTTSKELQRRVDALSRMEEKIRELVEFVKDKHNVHKVIKDYAKTIQRCLDIAKPTVAGLKSRSRDAEIQACSHLALRKRDKSSANTAKGKQESSSQLDEKMPRDNSQAKIAGKVEIPSQPQLKDISDTPPTTEDGGSAWHKVKSRKKSKKLKTRAPRPDALVLKAKEGSTYADILRSMKADPELQDLGTNVSKIRKSAAGNLVLVLRSNEHEKTDQLRLAVAEKLASKAEVVQKIEQTAVELRDLDELTDATEVLEAVKSLLGDSPEIGESVVRSLRKAYGGTQTAVVVLPTDQAKRLLDKGSVKVGWVVSRIRAKITPPRCFRCLGLGHTARSCTGPDRSKACFRCGQEGHMGKTCSAEPKCLLCTENGGHATGSYGCPVFQRAVRDANERAKR